MKTIREASIGRFVCLSCIIAVLSMVLYTGSESLASPTAGALPSSEVCQHPLADPPNLLACDSAHAAFSFSLLNGWARLDTYRCSVIAFGMHGQEYSLDGLFYRDYCVAYLYFWGETGWVLSSSYFCWPLNDVAMTPRIKLIDMPFMGFMLAALERTCVVSPM